MIVLKSGNRYKFNVVNGAITGDLDNKRIHIYHMGTLLDYSGMLLATIAINIIVFNGFCDEYRIYVKDVEYL